MRQKLLKRKITKQKLFFVYTLLLVFISLLLALGYHVSILPLEQLVSFSPVVIISLLLGLGLGAIVAIYKRKTVKRYSIITLGIAGLFCIYSLGYSLTVQPQVHLAQSSSATIKFAAFNKLYRNHNMDRAAEYFKAHKIDIIALEEAEPQDVSALQKQLGFQYSYISEKRNTVQGTAAGLVSRYPIKERETLAFSAHTSVVRAVVETPKNGRVAFYGAHISGPFTQKMYSWRNADFVQLAAQLQDEKLPAVLGGDFNTTIFSPALHKFNGAIENKYQTTTPREWPPCSWYSKGSILCLRIDHVYLPKNAQLVNTYVAPNLGSDHRAVIAEFSL